MTNWGRWSESDEVGALNLVTPERVRDSARLVTEGHVVSLARTIRYDIVRAPDRPPPTLVLTTDGGDYAAGAAGVGGAFFADDFLAMPVATGTHIDALAHAWSPEGLYNGHPANSVRSRGAKFCGIDKMPPIVTSGVLADICTLHGVDTLPPSHVVTAAEIEAATVEKGVPVEAGDALLIRTGWLTKKNVESHAKGGLEQEPGIGVEAAEWIAARDIAVVGADNVGVEVFPSEDPDRRAPVHVALISKFGVPLIELLDLEELARLEPRRFLFVAAPLRLRGAVNSPLNPIAVL